MIILLIFSIMFDYEWLIFLNFFPSVDLQMGSSLYIVKNQALIANYSMTGLKGCFIQCLSVIYLSRFILKEIFLSKIRFPNLFHFQCILTMENHQLSSQLKAFNHPVISTMLLFHTFWHVESILYVCSFKIYKLER